MNVLFGHFNKGIIGILDFMKVQDKIIEVQEEFVFRDAQFDDPFWDMLFGSPFRDAPFSCPTIFIQI